MHTNRLFPWSGILSQILSFDLCGKLSHRLSCVFKILQDSKNIKCSQRFLFAICWQIITFDWNGIIWGILVLRSLVCQILKYGMGDKANTIHHQPAWFCIMCRDKTTERSMTETAGFPLMMNPIMFAIQGDAFCLRITEIISFRTFCKWPCTGGAIYFIQYGSSSVQFVWFFFWPDTGTRHWYCGSVCTRKKPQMYECAVWRWRKRFFRELCCPETSIHDRHSCRRSGAIVVRFCDVTSFLREFKVDSLSTKR